MLQTIEGTYQNGIIQLTELPQNISNSRVLITFLEKDIQIENQRNLKSSKIIHFGMFSGENQSMETDFQEAEFNKKL